MKQVAPPGISIHVQLLNCCAAGAACLLLLAPLQPLQPLQLLLVLLQPGIPPQPHVPPDVPQLQPAGLMLKAVQHRRVKQLLHERLANGRHEAAGQVVGHLCWGQHLVVEGAQRQQHLLGQQRAGRVVRLQCGTAASKWLTRELAMPFA